MCSKVPTAGQSDTQKKVHNGIMYVCRMHFQHYFHEVKIKWKFKQINKKKYTKN